MKLEIDFERRYGAISIQPAFALDFSGFRSVALFGPSGCGKTTVLRALAGLERPDAGRIRLGTTDWFDAERKIHLSPQGRRTGMLFQDYALFPHLTVAQNIGYGVAPADRGMVTGLIGRFDLSGRENHYPNQLSGGQQQRVALARAIACRPRLLLLDEPLSALDSVLREHVRNELRDMLRQFGIPVILVTHDRSEAMALADEIVVMRSGRVIQQGSIAKVFSEPCDAEAARLLGVETVLQGKIVKRDGELCSIKVGSTVLRGVCTQECGEEALVGIRAEEVMLSPEPVPGASAQNQLPACVTRIILGSPLCRVELDAGIPLVATLTADAIGQMRIETGLRVTALIKASCVRIFPA